MSAACLGEPTAHSTGPAARMRVDDEAPGGDEALGALAGLLRA